MPGLTRSQRRVLPSALVGALAVAILLPATALATDPLPSDPPSPGALESPSIAPAGDPTTEPTEVPTSPPEPSPTVEATPEPTTDPTPDPTQDPTPVDEPPASPDGSPIVSPSNEPGSPPPDAPPADSSPEATAPHQTGTAEPTSHATAAPGTPTPGAASASPTHGVSTAAADGTLSGYRYTIGATALYAARDTSSDVLLALAADTQVSVSEVVHHGGRDWITASRNGITGYVPASDLSMTSALTALSLRRFVKEASAIYTEIVGEYARAISAGMYTTADATALDHLGRRWVRVTFSDSAGTHRGFQPWWHTTTTPVAVSGTWTAVRTTTLYMYPDTDAAVRRTVAAGAPASRRSTVTDTDGLGWTQTIYASTWGWMRSIDLTPPYRQFIWNRSSPITQQYTNYYCVPASVQTELNIGLRRWNTSNTYQRTIYYYGRRNLGYWTGGVGLDPQAWRRSLRYFSGYSVEYGEATHTSYYAAVKAAALQMRRTGLPVGLLVYYGGHAWTMIGYTATADPLRTGAFRVTGVYVAAPFVRWTDPPAGTYYSYSGFARKLTPYWEEVRWTRWNGLYTLIIPTA